MRTDYLRQARAAFDRGQLFADELKAAEDKLSVENRPSIDRFRFVKEQEDESTVANPLFSMQFDFWAGWREASWLFLRGPMPDLAARTSMRA